MLFAMVPLFLMLGELFLLSFSELGPLFDEMSVHPFYHLPYNKNGNRDPRPTLREDQGSHYLAPQQRWNI